MFELALDASPAVGHRACGYFARECLESARNRFAVLLQFLARYARDEREVGHVAVFVRNALVDPQGDHQGDPQGGFEEVWGRGVGEALEVGGLVEALAGQRGEQRLAVRELQLVAALLRAVMAVLHGGEGEGDDHDGEKKGEGDHNNHDGDHDDDHDDDHDEKEGKKEKGEGDHDGDHNNNDDEKKDDHKNGDHYNNKGDHEGDHKNDNHNNNDNEKKDDHGKETGDDTMHDPLNTNTTLTTLTHTLLTTLLPTPLPRSLLPSLPPLLSLASHSLASSLPTLLAMYRTETPLLPLLLDLVALTRFSSLDSLHATMAQLAQLFPSQTHPALANHLLAALTAIATQEGGSHTLDSLIDSLVTNSLQKWTRVNREEAIQILSPESRESAARKLLDSYVALANLFCFRDISRQLQDSRVFEAAEVLRNDLLSLPESGVFLQLQFQCLRLQQLKLLYRFAAAGETPDDALGVSLQLFLETAGEALSRAMSRGDDAIFPLEQLLCDALIPAGDRFITEDLTRRMFPRGVSRSTRRRIARAVVGITRSVGEGRGGGVTSGGADASRAGAVSAVLCGACGVVAAGGAAVLLLRLRRGGRGDGAGAGGGGAATGPRGDGGDAGECAAVRLRGV